MKDILEFLEDLENGEILTFNPMCCNWGIGGKCSFCNTIWFECACGDKNLDCVCGSGEGELI